MKVPSGSFRSASSASWRDIFVLSHSLMRCASVNILAASVRCVYVPNLEQLSLFINSSSSNNNNNNSNNKATTLSSRFSVSHPHQHSNTIEQASEQLSKAFGVWPSFTSCKRRNITMTFTNCRKSLCGAKQCEWKTLCSLLFLLERRKEAD